MTIGETRRDPSEMRELARRKLFVTRDNSRKLDHYLPPGRFQYRESFREALNHFAPLSSIVLHFHYSCSLSSISLFKCCVISRFPRLPLRNPLFLHSCILPRARASYKSLSGPGPGTSSLQYIFSSGLPPPNRDFSLTSVTPRLALSRLVSISLRAPRRFTASASPVPSSAAAALIYDQHGSTDSCITLRRREPGSS